MPQQNNDHKDFVLIDAFGINQDDLVKIIDIIDLQKPKLLIADIFHHSNFNDKTLTHMIETHSEVLFSLPVVISDTDQIDYFDSYQSQLEVFTKYNQHVGLYDLKNLYEQTAYKSIPPFEYHDLLSLIPNVSIEESLNQQYYTNYNGIPPFAKIYAKNILEKNFIPELIEDKIILLSNFDNSYVMSSYNLQLGEKFLHQTHLAFLIKSAMYNNWLQHFSLWQYFLFLSLLIIFWIILSYHFSYRYIQFIFTLSIITPFSVYWIALSYGSFLLPISEMTFITITLTFFLLRHWKSLKDKEESNLLSQMAKRLQDKVTHQTFYNSDKYWSDLITMMNQLFPFKKAILLKKLDNDTRIYEIASFNCTISELRRDYTREPYASAIFDKSIHILQKQFFHGREDNEKEFIVPLLYRNEVIGFWAFSIESAEVDKIKNFTPIINNLSKEISELLFHRTQFHQQKKNKQNLARLLNVETEDRNIHIIKNNFSIIEKRMLLNETIFDAIPSKIITYNLFGEIIQINKGMHYLFEQEKVSAYTLNASGMLSNLTDISELKAKALIRDVTFNHKQHMQFVYCKFSQKKFLLTISPLTEQHIENKFAENYLFQTYGLLFAFIDFNFVEKIYNLRQDVIDISLQQTQSRLHALEQTIELLDKGLLTAEQHKIITSELKQKIYDMDFTHNQLDMLMKQNLDNDQDDQYPLQITKSIDQSCNYITEKYREKQITFDISAPAFLPLVLVSVNSINDHLVTLFNFLADDSEESGVITINIQVDKKHMNIVMHSSGYGMPNEQLMSYLMYVKSAPDTYTKVLNTYQAIKQWSGDIHLSSNLGEGITIFMSLKVVSL